MENTEVKIRRIRDPKTGTGTKVTLQKKHGVWFVMESQGQLKTGDFDWKGWGYTETALNHAMKKLGLMDV